MPKSHGDEVLAPRRRCLSSSPTRPRRSRSEAAAEGRSDQNIIKLQLYNIVFPITGLTDTVLNMCQSFSKYLITVHYVHLILFDHQITNVLVVRCLPNSRIAGEEDRVLRGHHAVLSLVSLLVASSHLRPQYPTKQWCFPNMVNFI